jgi:hypothetical protein
MLSATRRFGATLRHHRSKTTENSAPSSFSPGEYDKPLQNFQHSEDKNLLNSSIYQRSEIRLAHPRP